MNLESRVTLSCLKKPELNVYLQIVIFCQCNQRFLLLIPWEHPLAAAAAEERSLLFALVKVAAATAKFSGGSAPTFGNSESIHFWYKSNHCQWVRKCGNFTTSLQVTEIIVIDDSQISWNRFIETKAEVEEGCFLFGLYDWQQQWRCRCAWSWRRRDVTRDSLPSGATRDRDGETAYCNVATFSHILGSVCLTHFYTMECRFEEGV